MPGVDFVLKTGINVVKQAREAKQVFVSPETGTIVQRLVSKDNVKKIISFGEGTPMRKLGITDSVLTTYKGCTPHIEFFGKNIEPEYDEIMRIYSNRGVFNPGQIQRLYNGNIDGANGFIKAMKSLSENRVGNLKLDV